MKIPFKNEGEIKVFSDEENLKEFVARKLSLKEGRWGGLQTEGKWSQKKVWSFRKGGDDGYPETAPLDYESKDDTGVRMDTEAMNHHEGT